MPNDDYTRWPLMACIMQSTCKSLCVACHTGHLISAPSIKFVHKVVLEVKHANREVKKIVFSHNIFSLYESSQCVHEDHLCVVAAAVFQTLIC